jgi:hypothetical protein
MIAFDRIQTEIRRLLPAILEWVGSSRHLQYYLGNGKDGIIYRMFNPEDGDDRSFDGFVMKVWNKEFRARQAEIDLQEEAYAGSGAYKVPRIVCVDPGERAFAMDRVPGETAYRLLFRKPKRISETLHDGILDGFRDLNAKGIVHADAHTLNYMLAEPLYGTGPDSNVVIDADLWIIDFGRSCHGASDTDIVRIRSDLAAKIVSVADA